MPVKYVEWLAKVVHGYHLSCVYALAVQYHMCGIHTVAGPTMLSLLHDYMISYSVLYRNVTLYPLLAVVHKQCFFLLPLHCTQIVLLLLYYLHACLLRGF